MEVKVHDGGRRISTFEQFADGTCSVRFYYLMKDGWSPPLPPDIQLPGRASSRSRAGTIARTARSRRTLADPPWLLNRSPVDRSDPPGS